MLDEIRTNGVTAARAGARQEDVPRRLHLRERQPGEPRPPLRLGASPSAARSADIESWPQAIAKVTPDDVKKAAANYLDLRRSVTGWLLPEPEEAQGAGEHVEQPVAHSRS